MAMVNLGAGIKIDPADFKAIGQRIRAARQKAGWTQVQLSKKCQLGDYGQIMVSQWETGAKVPNSLSLMKLAHALHLDLNELLGLPVRQSEPRPPVKHVRLTM